MKSKKDDSHASEGIRWLGRITYNHAKGQYEYTPFDGSEDEAVPVDLDEFVENSASSDSF